MRKSAFALVFCLFASFPLHAGEMFEAYPKRLALGYVEDEANLRYWLNPAWGLELAAKLSDNSVTAKANDGVTIQEDRADSDGYTIRFSAVRTIKNFEYFDLNLKAGFSYSSGDAHSEPEGPANDAFQESRSHSLFIGPEVEIKIPFLSRLVIVSSIQATYLVEKVEERQENPFGTVFVEQENKSFSLSGDKNSLDEFIHLGVRYYF